MYDKKRICFVFLISAFISLIFCRGILANLSYWGKHDWDQFCFWFEASRVSILKYGQFPLWNPFGNGGNILLAHPHSGFLSPVFLPVLLFGTLIGLKISVVIFLIIGLMGMYFLAVEYGCAPLEAYFSSAVFMLSSFYAAHLSMGHIEWLAMAMLPWLLLCYLNSLRSQNFKFLIFGALTLTSMQLLGSVDVFNISILFLAVYSLLESFKSLSFKPLYMLFFILAVSFLTGAIKFLPMLEFLNSTERFAQRINSNDTGTPVTFVVYALINAPKNLYSGIRHWHEHSSYIGITPLVLGIMGSIFFLKKYWPLLITSVIFFVIGAGNGFSPDLWSFLHKFPVYRSLTQPSRYIIVTLLGLAIFSGLFIHWLRSRKYLERPKFIAFIFVACVILDLICVNSGLFLKAFPIKPPQIDLYEKFAQRHRYHNPFKGIANSGMFSSLLSNSGLVNSYEVLNIERGNLSVVSEPNYRGEAYFERGGSGVEIVRFSPNNLSLAVAALNENLLVINQNYAKGWHVRIDAKRGAVIKTRGLISCGVPAGEHRVEFYYLPFSFIAGSLVSFLSLLAVIFYLRKK